MQKLLDNKILYVWIFFLKRQVCKHAKLFFILFKLFMCAKLNCGIHKMCAHTNNKHIVG